MLPTDFKVLLTPFLGPTRHDVDNACDPFEWFGQALVKHRWNIRHSATANGSNTDLD